MNSMLQKLQFQGGCLEISGQDYPTLENTKERCSVSECYRIPPPPHRFKKPRDQLSHTGSCSGTSLPIAPSRISSKWSHKMCPTTSLWECLQSEFWTRRCIKHLTATDWRLLAASLDSFMSPESVWVVQKPAEFRCCSERLSKEVEVALISLKIQTSSKVWRNNMDAWMSVFYLCFSKIVPFLMSRIFPQRISSAFLRSKWTWAFGSFFVSFVSFISRRSSCGWSPSWTSGSSEDAALTDCWFRFSSC